LFRDAIFLDANLTVQGGSDIIQKYSGKAPELYEPKHVPLGELSLMSSHESGRSAQLQLSQRRLDVILQETAKGIYKRGERWGVNQAVRGAVEEVRRNIQGLQSGSTTQRQFPASNSSDTAAGLFIGRPSKDFHDLQSRNIKIAIYLGDLLSRVDMKSYENTGENTIHSGDNQHSLSELLLAIHQVKSCLEDPSIALPWSIHQADTKLAANDPAKEVANVTDRKEPPITRQATVTTTGSNNDTTQDPLNLGPEEGTRSPVRPSAGNIESTRITPPSTKTPTNDKSISNINQTPVPINQESLTSHRSSSTNKTTPSRITPGHKPRPSLSDSTFAWMLADNTGSTSETRKQPQTSIPRSPKPRKEPVRGTNVGFLYGDDEDDTKSIFGNINPN
jgi:TBC1 domain family protein 5